ncbi:MAG: hypothetical protein OK438_01705 [Thaumarchaeota archaeon]|nr:hypothetical protein [Nitrososphaerota archaeon]
MNNRGTRDDLSALLYLVPFLASGVYALYLWIAGGISAYLPTGVYLTVTRDPYVFVAGSLAVMLAVTLDFTSADPAERPARLNSLGNTLQSMGAASLVLALFFAWYANGFLDVSGAATDFILGRFSLVFPAALVLLSYLITARFNLASLKNPKPLGIIALLLVPVSVDLIGKRNLSVGLGTALILLIIGVVLLLRSTAKKAAPEKN